ncbi:MAG: NADH-quinone oxidoreductase subunit N [Planctomycetia bacterium]|nr:NADH-quinone oxidoreductase subunit N [Planctomycetia bacterium]
MDYQQLIQYVIGDTAGSLRLFQPELIVCGTILVMLGLRVFNLTRRIPTWLVALAGVGLALTYALPWHHLATPPVPGSSREFFTGMLVYDNFTIFFRGLLLVFAILFILFTQVSGIPDRDDAADFYTLVLGSMFGMMLMASANHLLVIFLAVEMASVPSYVLAGMLKGRRRSSEAALKYAVYGAGAAGIMLYGISLLAGTLGSCHLPTMAARLATLTPPGTSDPNLMVLVLGGLMVMVGLAFKLSAVPFHFWCPDVFEGASAEVNAFLSVASKAAALALLVRVAIGFGTVPNRQEVSPPPVAVYQAIQDPAGASDQFQQEKSELIREVEMSEESRTDIEQSKVESPNQQMRPPDSLTSLTVVRQFMIYVIVLISAITCTFGNLAAYGQTNIKRLLAYSTIAHAGYMMMPVAAGLSLMNSGHPNPGAAEAFSSLLFYVAVYVFMNLGAFAVVALLRNAMRSEEISDYAGLIRSAPGVTVCFVTILFSLIGVPPLAGFLGKFFIFEALIKANTAPTIALLVIGGLNTALALYYYLRVIKVMTIDPPPADRPPVEFSLVSIPGAYVVAITLPLLLLMLDCNGLGTWTLNACLQLIPGH